MGNKADQKAAAAQRADKYSRSLSRKDLALARAQLGVIRARDGGKAAADLVRYELDRRNR